MNPVGEGGNQSPITPPTSIADAPPVIGGTESINQPVNPATPKIPGVDPALGEKKLIEEEEKFTNVAEQTAPSSEITTEDSQKPPLQEDPPPMPPLQEYLDRFKLSKEPNITLSSEPPTLTNLNQPPTEASSDAASPNPVTLNDLLTKGPQAVFDEPVPAAPEVGKVPQPENSQTAVENTVSAAEVSPEKTPKEKLFEEIKQIVDKYVIETKVG